MPPEARAARDAQAARDAPPPVRCAPLSACRGGLPGRRSPLPRRLVAGARPTQHPDAVRPVPPHRTGPARPTPGSPRRLLSAEARTAAATDGRGSESTGSDCSALRRLAVLVRDDDMDRRPVAARRRDGREALLPGEGPAAVRMARGHDPDPPDARLPASKPPRKAPGSSSPRGIGIRTPSGHVTSATTSARPSTRSPNSLREASIRKAVPGSRLGWVSRAPSVDEEAALRAVCLQPVEIHQPRQVSRRLGPEPVGLVAHRVSVGREGHVPGADVRAQRGEFRLLQQLPRRSLQRQAHQGRVPQQDHRGLDVDLGEPERDPDLRRKGEDARPRAHHVVGGGRGEDLEDVRGEAEAVVRVGAEGVGDQQASLGRPGEAWSAQGCSPG
ncbi:hypothetical protein SAMN04487983_107716 [Streptomyces sp. yr375]|nr:hypothetical protein SAMN04487983_107716 [Streptomyces sp. yr375]